MSFWTAVENLGTRPPRSWVFDIGCAASAALASFGTFSFAQTAHPAHPALAVSLVVAALTALVLPLRRVWPGPVFCVVVLTAAVLAQWPVRGALFPVALAICLYTVAASPEPRPPSHPAAQLRQGLTSREQDVFSRIAAGMSNSEIAASLFLSEGTVKIHVGRILAKLGLRDRVQAVVLAYESRLITPGTPPPGGPREPQ
jgi:DNA-binding CsgD family transcriptional regulator